MTRQKSAKTKNFSGVGNNVALVMLAFFCASIVHYINYTFLNAENPDALRESVTVMTSDDASYFRPALNFLDFGVWKGSDAGVAAYVQRSPGYGMLFGISVYLFGETNGLLVLVMFQLVLWSLAVGCIPFLFQNLGFKAKWSWWLAILVSVMPMFYGFLSYTLTEAVTPSLVIFFYTCLFMGLKKDHTILFLSAIVLGFLIIVRPVMILLILCYLPFFPDLKRRLVPVILIALLPIFLWQIRVHRFTGRFDLHPIYHTDASSVYRPLHAAIWDFHKMTGQTGVEFHKSINMLWQATDSSIDGSKAAKAVIDNFHPTVLQTFSERELTAAYTQYVAVLTQQVPYRLANEPINQPLVGESDLTLKFESMKKEYVSKHFFRSWVIVPVEVMENLVVHSNLSLYMFQKPLRGNILIEILRWISLSVHLFIYLFFVFFFFLKKNPVTISLALPSILFFSYLIFIQRGIEERYMLPYLIPLFLLAVRNFTLLFPREVRHKFLKSA